MTPNEALQAAKEALDKALAEKKMNQELIRSLGPAIIEALQPVLAEVATNSKITREQLVEAISGITINVPKADIPQAEVKVTIPEIVVPQPQVNVTVPPIKIPEIKIPKITVPKPEVTVNVPEIKIPDLKWPTERMPIEGWVNLMGIDLQNPLPVRVTNAKDFGSQVSALMGGGGGIVTIGGALTTVGVVTINPDGQPTYSVSSGGGGSGGSVYLYNGDNLPYNSGNPFPVSATFSGATVVTIINNDGLAYNSDNPLPVTGSFSSTPAPQVSGYADSVNVMQYGGAAIATGLNETNAGVFRSVIMTDSVTSVNVVTTVGLTDTQLRASTVDIKQVSGSVDSVSIITVSDIFSTTSTSNVVTPDNRVKTDGSGVTQPISVTDIFATTAASSVVDPDNRVKVDVNMIAGLNETNAGVIRTVQMTDSVSSVVINSGTITTVTTVTGVTNSVGASIVDSSGVQYSGTNPVPTNNSQWGGNVVPTGLNETTNGVIRVVQMTDSVASVVVNSGTITTVTTVTGITNTVNTRLDSPDGAYSAANPFPVTLISGALTSTIAVGDTLARTADSGAAPVKIGGIARTTNPTSYADGDRANFGTDKIGRQLIRNVQARDLIATAYTTISNGTEATVLTAGAGTYLDCIAMMFSNTSGVSITIDVRAVSGGNIVHTVVVPAGGTAGWAPAVPWPQDATGNAWTLDGPDVTGSTVYVSSLFSKEV